MEDLIHQEPSDEPTIDTLASRPGGGFDTDPAGRFFI